MKTHYFVRVPWWLAIFAAIGWAAAAFLIFLLVGTICLVLLALAGVSELIGLVTGKERFKVGRDVGHGCQQVLATLYQGLTRERR